MSTLYEKISKLCAENNITGYRMCKDIGIQPSIMTDLKSGRKKGHSAETAQKIANYFSVTVGELLGSTDTKKETPDTEVSDEDLKIALFHGATDVTDAMWEEAREYARFIYERERKKREKN